MDAAYSKRATEVCEGKITTAKQLNEAMKELVPTDAQFQAEFATCRVTKASLARYYLRALELRYRGEKEPEFVPNEDQSEINLEHVLPENPGKGWAIKAELAAAFYMCIVAFDGAGRLCRRGFGGGSAQDRILAPSLRLLVSGSVIGALKGLNILSNGTGMWRSPLILRFGRRWYVQEG